MTLAQWVLPDVLGNLFLDLIALAPGESISRLETGVPANTDRMEDLLLAMPNIERLNLFNAASSKGFLQPNPDGPRASTKFLSSLQSLYLGDINLSDNDWGHLTRYLAHQISGGQSISLAIGGSFHMCPQVAKEVENLVGEFGYSDPWAVCPVGRCEVRTRSQYPGVWRL